MKVKIKENHNYADGHSEVIERNLVFKWNGKTEEFVMTSKAFNPCFEKVFISPYDMKIKGVHKKTGLVVNLYEKYLTDAIMEIQL